MKNNKIEYVVDKITGLHKVVLKGRKVRMTPIVQTGTFVAEPFHATINRASSEKMGDFDACINGQWYGLAIGTAANQGLSILASDEIYGKSSPKLWSICQTENYEWVPKLGDPTTEYYTGIGGLCPLIVNGLAYGEVNVYNKKDLTNPILSGEPKPEHKPYLFQRSSRKFHDLNIASNAGKVGFGIKANGNVVIFLEENITAKMNYYAFRNLFIHERCMHAFACDGSDSVFLHLNKRWRVRAAVHKDNTQTSGIGFRIDD